jgi:hypothetical protein
VQQEVLLILRILTWSLSSLLLVAVVFYMADYATWRARSGRGEGTDSVVVSRVTVATLKGNKEEYYFDGTDVLPCTRSLLPLPTAGGWGTPCWWLRGHRQVVTRY